MRLNTGRIDDCNLRARTASSLTPHSAAMRWSESPHRLAQRSTSGGGVVPRRPAGRDAAFHVLEARAVAPAIQRLAAEHAALAARRADRAFPRVAASGEVPRGDARRAGHETI